MLADLVVDLLVPEIAFDAQARGLQLLDHLQRIVVRIRHDRRDDDLEGSEPQREVTGEVLDQDAREALQRAEHRAVDHHRRLLLGMLVDVERAEAAREVEVHLRRAALPVAADGVLQHVFELRSVERALARLQRRLHASVRALRHLVEHVLQRLLGLVPQLVRADALFRPRRELDEDVLEAEVVIDREHQIVDLEALLHDLIFGDEDVRVVLREVAHAQHAVQRARRLVAVHLAELGDLQGQVAVALEPVLVDLHVARAVHRLAAEHALVR